MKEKEVTFTVSEESFALLKDILEFYEGLSLDCLFDTENLDDLKRIRDDLRKEKQLKKELGIPDK